MKDSILFMTVCCIMLANLTAFGRSQGPKAQSSAESKYKVGQKWGYKTRAGEEGSYFIVLKIENYPKLGIVVHIAVRGLRMDNPRSPDGISENVDHMPFSLDAIDKSATKLLKEKTDLPSFEAGYNAWRDAFDVGNAGIYTISLAEAVKVMEASLNQ